MAKDTGSERVILEVDSTGVAAKLMKEECDRSAHGMLVEEIKLLLNGFEEILVRTVRRSANGVAHSLAKEGCENKSCMVWTGNLPDCIVNLLELDMSRF